MTDLTDYSGPLDGRLKYDDFSKELLQIRAHAINPKMKATPSNSLRERAKTTCIASGNSGSRTSGRG